MKAYINLQIVGSQNVMANISTDDNLLSRIANACVKALNKGGKILFVGNGGSAAEDQHIAAEFVSRFTFDRVGYPTLSLATDTSILTAIGNDYGYENPFAREIFEREK